MPATSFEPPVKKTDDDLLHRVHELETALAALTITEERLNFAIEASGDGLWDWDIENNTVEFSPRWKSMLGYEVDEISNDFCEWSKRIHPEDMSHVMASVQGHLDGRRTTYSTEHRMQCKDGGYKWILAKGKVVQRSTEGKPQRMVITHSDITATKIINRTLESALRESAALLSALNQHAIVSVTDNTGKILEVNEAYCAISGYSREEAIGQNHRIDNSGMQSDTFWDAMWRDIAAGKAWRGTLCNRTKDGALYWVDTFIAPFMNADGNIEKYISIRTNITTAKNQEAALLSSSSQLMKAADVAELGIWTWNLTTNQLHWDERMFDIYDIPDELRESSLPYDYWRSQIHPDDIANIETQLRGAISGLYNYNVNFRIVKQDGSIRYIQAGGHVERDQHGTAVMMMGINRDITLQHNVEESLRIAKQAADEANRAKSEFLANMSHEIRTPMNAILGMLALLRKTELNSRQEDYASKSEGAARSLLVLLNDILDVSKAESGKMVLDPHPFNLDYLIRDLSVILSTNLTHKPVELLFDIAPDVPRFLMGDAMRLQQILINLGGNAIKFTERGHVSIAIHLNSIIDNNASLHFCVQDTGIGIAPENQSKIFNSFIQAEASTTRRFGGTGLGIAISQALVQLMGGKLELKSSIGKGSRFSFDISLSLLNKEASTSLHTSLEQTTKNTNQMRLKNMSLLLVEDNLLNQQIALELLECEGAIVTIASNGKEAVDLLNTTITAESNTHFDAVLMDLQMPIMDGISATGIIRNTLGLVNLPIIAMTANAMPSDRERCFDAGMNEHVGKPLHLDHLVAILHSLTGWKMLATTYSPSALPSSINPAAKIISIAEANSIELGAAFNRFCGNQALYLRMLPTFLTTLDALPAQFQAYLAQNDLHTVLRALHSLKGFAATMGVTKLALEAAKVEKILAQDPSISDAKVVKNAIEQICSAITNNIPALNNLLEHMQRDAPPPTSPDTSHTAAPATMIHNTLETALSVLAQQLNSSNMSALKTIDSLQQQFSHRVDVPLAPLSNAIHSLNFAEALQLCAQLMANRKND